MKITEILKEHKYKKIDSKEMQKYFDEYTTFVETVQHALNQGLLAPIKASGSNGRMPPLYNSYKILSEKVDDEESLKKEILTFPPEFDRSYYLNNLSDYRKDRNAVSTLRGFFSTAAKKRTLETPSSINERSFQIFNDEKFISEYGRNIMTRLKLDAKALNCYGAPEPFFYYAVTAQSSNNILIIENKDTFFTIKRVFQESGNKIMGITFNMLIYGEGKKIESSIEFLSEIPSFKEAENHIYYFGDIDFEGIGIFQDLCLKAQHLKIEPFTYLYKKTLEACIEPPQLRKSQRQRDIAGFQTFFDENTAIAIEEILSKGKYIPQEALGYAFFTQIPKDTEAD